MGHGHTHTNFDEAAATWDDDPVKVERSRLVAEGIASAVPLEGIADAIEYGSGTGQVTWALADRLRRVTLLDASPGMTAVAQERIASLSPADQDRFAARVFDVTQETLPEASVDLIYMSMALHHVSDVPLALARFHAALRPGGHLVVADLDHDPQGAFHGRNFDGHHGFDRGRLAAHMEAAGFASPTFSTLTTLTKELEGQTMDFPVFLAVTQKA